jgi:hypothetical protein
VQARLAALLVAVVAAAGCDGDDSFYDIDVLIECMSRAPGMWPGYANAENLREYVFVSRM